MPKGVSPVAWPMAAEISASWVLPVKPNTKAIPYSISAELMAPIIRNFMPASLERWFIRKAANAASGSVVSSREI